MMSHLGNFVYNVGQRIVLNHAIVYNEAVHSDIHDTFIHGTFSLHSNSMRTSTVALLIRFAESNR